MSLYYQEPYRDRWNAKIALVEPLPEHSAIRVALNRTGFYPGGGGQPSDRGSIDGIPVITVDKSSDNTIFHHLAEDSLPRSFSVGDTVECRIDWSRRYDYMQQHSGQHVISSALMAHNIPTLSVHLGKEYVTIEVDSRQIPPNIILDIERRAREIVCSNIPIRDYWIDSSQIEALKLRRPPKIRGAIRVVEIEQVDRVGCGGVHVKATGEIELIKFSRFEKIRGRLRLIWRVGRRAIDEYRRYGEMIDLLSDRLSSQPNEIADRTLEMIERRKRQKYEYSQLEQRVAQMICERVIAGNRDDARCLRCMLDNESKEIERLTTEHFAAALREDSRVKMVLIVNIADKYFTWSICSLHLDAERIRSVAHIIDGKGGGKAPIWRGVGSNAARLDDFFSSLISFVAS